MSLLSPNEGRAEMLGYVVNGATQADLKIGLYSNDLTPAAEDAYASYTLITEPADANVKTFTGASWDITSTEGTASYPQLTFTFSTTATAYGYMVSNNDGDAAMWSERFTGAPYEIPSGGGTIKVTSTITLANA